MPGLRPENVPGYKIIKSNEGDIFISLNNLNDECIDKINRAFNDKITIEEYLEKYKKLVKTEYQKKCEKFNQPVKPHKHKKIVIEETASITPEEEYILKPKKKGSKKIIVKRGQAQKTKRKTGIKKRRLLIIDSDTEKLTN